MLCPFCQRPVAAFVAPGEGGAGLRCPYPDCAGAAEDVPLLYSQDYAQHPAVPVSIFGPTGHGKTMFIEALLTHLERRVRWPGYSCQWMDEGGMQAVRGRLRELRETGRIADATARVFPRPMVLRLRQVPRVGGCQLLLYDTSGETFTNSDDLAESGRYVRNSKAVVWLVSLTELEYPEQLSDLMTVYAQAMAKMGASPRGQSLVLGLTKADLLVGRPDLPAAARAFLTDDDLDPDGDAWARLEAVSEALKDWLLAGEHRNLVNLLAQQFHSVRYCLLSAQGAAAQGGTLQMDLMPRGVLAPLFWIWRLTRSLAWAKPAGAPAHYAGEAYFDLARAISGAGSGGTVRLDAGAYELSSPVRVARPVTVVGAGAGATVVTSSAAECAVAVKAAGPVRFEGFTLAHAGPAPADGVRVFAGEVTFKGCTLTGAAAGAAPKVPGDGIVALGAAAVVRCQRVTLADNAGAGASARGGASLTLTECSLARNRGMGCVVHDSTLNAEGTSFEGNAQTGLHLGGAARATLSGGSLSRNQGHGLTVSGTAQAQVSRAGCEHNRSNGVVARDTAKVALDQVAAAHNGLAGALLSDQATGSVTRGVFSDNGASGVELAGGAAADVTGNHCRANKAPGITLGGRSTGLCEGNTCDANAGVGLLIVGQATPRLGANALSGNQNGDSFTAPTARPQAPRAEAEAPVTLAPAPANGKPAGEPGRAKKGWFR